MAIAEAVRHLTAAIQEDMRKELAHLRQELEHERQLRQLLEQQLAGLQEACLARADASSMFACLEQRLEAQSDSARKDGEDALRRAQRELEHRIEAVQESCNARADDRSAAVPSASDLPLLTREIDRKLGTMLMDIDHRVGTACKAAEVAAAAAGDGALRNAQDGHRLQSEKLEALQVALDARLDDIRSALCSQESAGRRFGTQIEALRSTLEQKIGMVQLDVDQLRVDMTGS